MTYQIQDLTANIDHAVSHVSDCLTQMFNSKSDKTLIPSSDTPTLSCDNAGSWSIGGKFMVPGTNRIYAYTAIVPPKGRQSLPVIRIVRYDGNRQIDERTALCNSEGISDAISKLEAIEQKWCSKVYRSNDGCLFTRCPACGNICDIFPDAHQPRQGEYDTQCDCCLQDFIAVDLNPHSDS